MLSDPPLVGVAAVAVSTPAGQVCPLCGLPDVSAVTRMVRGIVLSDLMCASGHLWMLKYVGVES